MLPLLRIKKEEKFIYQAKGKDKLNFGKTSTKLNPEKTKE